MAKEIKLDYVHLCDYACPAINQKINIIGIFDNFNDINAPDFFVAMRFTVKNKSEYKVIFKIVAKQGGQEVFADNDSTLITVPETAPTLSYNILKQIKGLNFISKGDYDLIIFVNEIEIGSLSVQVK